MCLDTLGSNAFIKCPDPPQQVQAEADPVEAPLQVQAEADPVEAPRQVPVCNSMAARPADTASSNCGDAGIDLKNV